MLLSRRLVATLAFALLPAAFSLPVAAKAFVTVTLDNKPTSSALPDNLGMAMPGADMSGAVMSVLAIPKVVPAGEVTFNATNRSPDFTHEMIVIKVADPTTQLPYVVGDSKVQEDAAGHLGEVSELQPGKSGSLTLNLDPGTYMLLCNVPGHYMAGMWTTIVVK